MSDKELGYSSDDSERAVMACNIGIEEEDPVVMMTQKIASLNLASDGLRVQT